MTGDSLSLPTRESLGDSGWFSEGIQSCLVVGCGLWGTRPKVSSCATQLTGGNGTAFAGSARACAGAGALSMASIGGCRAFSRYFDLRSSVKSAISYRKTITARQLLSKLADNSTELISLETVKAFFSDSLQLLGDL